MLINAAMNRLNRALDVNKTLTDRKVPPVEKPGDKKDDRDTFSSDILPDELQADSAR